MAVRINKPAASPTKGKLRKAKVVAPVSPEAYNEVVAKAQIVDLRLVSSSLEVQPKGLDGNRKGWAMSVGDELSEWALEKESGRLWGRVAFRASCRDGDETPIEVRGEYLVGYSIDGDADRLAARTFLKRVARFACYPYFRTLFASLTGQANLVFSPLPVLKEPARRLPPRKTAPSKTVAVKPGVRKS